MQQLFANPFAMYAETKDRIARNAMETERFSWERKQQEAEEEKRKWEREQKAREAADRLAKSGAAGYALGPAMARQVARPMAQGAPIPQVQPQAQPTGQSMDPAPMPQAAPLMDGEREVEQVIVTGMKDRAPSQVDVLSRQMQYYIDNGRQDLAMEIYPKFLEAKDAAKKLSKTEEEEVYTLYKETLQQVGSWATSVIPRLEQTNPKSNWQPQVMASVQSLAESLNRMGLDGNVILQQVKIDPTDTPQSIAQELRDIAATAFSEDAAKRFFAKPDIVNTGRQQIQVGGAGDILNRFNIGVSPNTALQSQTQIRTAQIGANSRIEAAKIRKAGDGEEEEQGQLGEVGPWTEYQQQPPQGQPQ